MNTYVYLLYLCEIFYVFRGQQGRDSAHSKHFNKLRFKAKVKSFLKTTAFMCCE